MREGQGTLRRLFHVLAALCLIALLGGCATVAVDELYSLPQPSEEYLQLQELIDEEIAAGCEYAAPTAGNYRQVLHIYDLDGDGETEAVAFLRDPEGVPKICIYSRSGEEYRLARTIPGEGSAIGSFDYADMNGDGCCELAVSWQASTGLSILKLYSLVGFSGEELLMTDCAAFRLADMDGDGLWELLALHTSGAEGCSVELFHLSAENSLRQSSASLSKGVTSVDRLRIGMLSDGATALFAESPCGEKGTVTDIFIDSYLGLLNITADYLTGVSSAVRDFAVYATDINGDRVLEVPAAQMENGEEDPVWIFDWYAYDSVGGRSLALSTCHCYTDGWFLRLPEGMRASLSVRREEGASGEKVVTFSERDPYTGESIDVLAVYTLTGDNRRERAKLGGRFVLAEASSAIYAARLPESSPYSAEQILEDFDLIYSEWNAGTL